MSARVYAFPRGLAKVPRPTAAEAAAWWRNEAAAARQEAARLSGEVLRALARAQSCDRFADRVQDSTCPEPRANETPGSPTRTEGDPTREAT